MESLHLRQVMRVFCVLCGLILVSAVHAAEWIYGTVKAPGSKIYREASQSSESLGVYSEGTRVRVTAEDRNGFYFLRLTKPFKGTTSVWIPINAIELESKRGPASGEGADQNSNLYRHSVGLQGNLSLLNPSDIQSFLGDTSGMFINLGIGGEYRYRLSPSVAIGGRFGYYSFKRPVSSLDNSAVNYFANGYLFMGNASYFIVTQKPYSFSVDLGLGVSFNTAGNSSMTTETSTTKITGYPISFSATGTFEFINHYEALVRLGYLIHSLSSVPVLALPNATTPSESDISLNSLFLSVGLNYSF